MWFERFEFARRNPPADETALQKFYAPLPADDVALEDACRYLEHAEDALVATGFRLPPQFYIPEELMQLWRYAEDGEVLGSCHDLNYFSPAGVVENYFCYQFWYYAPKLMPVAFDGGDTFYCYDFRQPDALQVVATLAGDAEDGCKAVGETLADVLTKAPNA